MLWTDPDTLAPLVAAAQMHDFTWSASAASITIGCQRVDEIGQPLPPVTLSLAAPKAVAISYDGRTIDARPSLIHVPGEARVGSLRPWPLPDRVAVTVNGRHECDDLRVAARADWLWGLPDAFAQAPWRIRLQPSARPAWPELDTSVWIATDQVEVTSDGASLDPETWTMEHAQWWLWADDEAYEPPTECRGVVLRGGCPDLSYVPPERLAFDPGPTDCPPALLAPLRAWHHGHLVCDWMSMARAFPHLDRTLPQHASALRAELLGAGFGAWHYVDGVDGWWVEGDRAAVSLRGIDHRLGLDGIEEARARWVFALRRMQRWWVIRGWRALD